MGASRIGLKLSRPLIVWIGAIALLTYLYRDGSISFWGTVLILLIANSIDGRENNRKKSEPEYVDHGPDPMEKAKDDVAEDIARLKAQIEATLRYQAEQQARFNEDRAQFRTRDRARNQEAQVGQDRIALDRSVIVSLRNTLLRHHNMKGTDKDYQESKAAKETTALVQLMNDLLNK